MNALLTAIAIVPAVIPVGPSMVQVDIGGTSIEVYTYKPETYRGERMIMVFHGTLRNADEYRDHAAPMGDRFNALIVAPKFDNERFPYQRYHLGGILKQDGSAASPEEWTFSMIPKLAQQIKEIEGLPEMPHYIVGHSAGGQFVMRMSGFVDTGAERLVSANPGTHLFPTRDMPYPYGLGGLPESLSGDSALRRYLAQPLTIYLGTTDVIHDRYFPSGELAFQQGDSRWERGFNNYHTAKRIAEERGWEFNWTLVEARAIHHDHGDMFNHPICEIALFGKYGALKTSDRRRAGSN